MLRRHRRQPRRSMQIRKLLELAAGPWPQAPSDSPQHPSPAQIQPIQMRELWIARIRRNHRPQPRHIRQKFPKPPLKLLRRKHPPHHIRLRQTRRQKVLARRFIPNRSIPVFEIKIPRPPLKQLAAMRIQHQPQRKRRIAMLPGSHRIRQLRKPTRKSLQHRVLQRSQNFRPQLRRQSQQPRQPIRTLKRRPSRVVQIPHLSRDILFRDIPRQSRPSLRSKLRIGKQPC